ncbi:MAG: peroxide stress protein YaaA [Mangrovibacterium sp.]
MLAIISPAKLLNFGTPAPTTQYSEAQFLKEATQVNAQMKRLKAKDLEQLQGISAELAMENESRNLLWQQPFTLDNAKQALWAFNGAVYGGIHAETFQREEQAFAQAHLRILSGLYGVLRPLDLIQPYRLEMGTKLGVSGKKDLYAFWKEAITAEINQLLVQNDGVLINLASNEYFKVIDKKKLKGRIITPQFKNNKNGAYKTIVIYAKQARGMMCRFFIENRLQNPEDLQAFDTEGYYFNNELSRGDDWLFTRDKQQ